MTKSKEDQCKDNNARYPKKKDNPQTDNTLKNKNTTTPADNYEAIKCPSLTTDRDNKSISITQGHKTNSTKHKN